MARAAAAICGVYLASKSFSGSAGSGSFNGARHEGMLTSPDKGNDLIVTCESHRRRNPHAAGAVFARGETEGTAAKGFASQGKAIPPWGTQRTSHREGPGRRETSLGFASRLYPREEFLVTPKAPRSDMSFDYDFRMR